MQGNILFFHSLDSTNRKAKELIRAGNMIDGTIIQAWAQEAGKGYGNNSWESEVGKNITASWVFKPGFLHPAAQFWLTKVFSLAVRDTVIQFTKTAEPIKIKWPNDIYAGSKKIAGILVENNIMGDTIRECIAGIGLNVNQLTFKSEAPNPVSMALLGGAQLNIDQCLDFLDQKLQSWYTKLQNNQKEFIANAYENALFRRGEWANFEDNGVSFRGKIETTDEYGRLKILKEDNSVGLYDFKEVKFII